MEGIRAARQLETDDPRASNVVRPHDPEARAPIGDQFRSATREREAFAPQGKLGFPRRKTHSSVDKVPALWLELIVAKHERADAVELAERRHAHAVPEVSEQRPIARDLKNRAEAPTRRK